jgi:hypothetical protein
MGRVTVVQLRERFGLAIFAFEHHKTTEKLRFRPISGRRFRLTLVWEQYLRRTFRLDESRPWKGPRTLKEAPLRALCVQLFTL